MFISFRLDTLSFQKLMVSTELYRVNELISSIIRVIFYSCGQPYVICNLISLHTRSLNKNILTLNCNEFQYLSNKAKIFGFNN